MKIQNILIIGIVMSLLIIFTGCPMMECIATHEIKQTIIILPQNDTIHVGDTLRFSTSFETTYEEEGKNVDISDREVDINCYLYNYSNNNPFFTGTQATGVENFEFILNKGIVQNLDILYNEGVSYREFYYELINSKFEVEFEIIVKDTGNYIMNLYSAPNEKYATKYCEENFELNYSFEISDEHKLNDYLLRDTTGIEKNSFYAFVVVE